MADQQFSINLNYNKRRYRYTVTHHCPAAGHEVFRIIRHDRIVIVESRWEERGRSRQRVFTYDQERITNRGLITKIIALIGQHLDAPVPSAAISGQLHAEHDGK